MGMFDYLRVHPAILPVAESVREQLSEKTKWQTKSLERALLLYRITNEGKLQIREDIMVDIPADEYQKLLDEHNKKYPPGHIMQPFGPEKREVAGHHWEDAPFHGYLNFYTSLEEHGWLEFTAQFADNVLIAVEKTERPGFQTKFD